MSTSGGGWPRTNPAAPAADASAGRWWANDENEATHEFRADDRDTRAPLSPEPTPEPIDYSTPDVTRDPGQPRARDHGGAAPATTSAGRQAEVSAGRGQVRKARLRLVRVDPWSVMKVAFLLSIAMGIVLFVAVATIWSVLDAAGVFGIVGGVVSDVTASETDAGFQVEEVLSLSRTLGLTTLLAVFDVVLITALATLGAFLYNLSASLLGGLELTLAEDD